MKPNLKASGWLTVAFTLVVALWAATAQAQPLITCNNAARGGGPITTYNSTGGAVVGSFVPTGAASDSNNGRGVEVIGNLFYYTELVGNFGSGPTDFIRIAPFNGGAGGRTSGRYPTLGQALAFRTWLTPMGCCTH
jgi:hypothetical protein